MLDSRRALVGNTSTTGAGIRCQNTHISNPGAAPSSFIMCDRYLSSLLPHTFCRVRHQGHPASTRGKGQYFNPYKTYGGMNQVKLHTCALAAARDTRSIYLTHTQHREARTTPRLRTSTATGSAWSWSTAAIIAAIPPSAKVKEKRTKNKTNQVHTPSSVGRTRSPAMASLAGLAPQQ